MKNNTNIQYRQVGDFNIPNLILPPEEASVRLGKWGMMYKDYLEKHKKVLFNSLLIQGKLYQHKVYLSRGGQCKGQYNPLLHTLKVHLLKAEYQQYQLQL